LRRCAVAPLRKLIFQTADSSPVFKTIPSPAGLMLAMPATPSGAKSQGFRPRKCPPDRPDGHFRSRNCQILKPGTTSGAGSAQFQAGKQFPALAAPSGQAKDVLPVSKPPHFYAEHPLLQLFA